MSCMEARNFICQNKLSNFTNSSKCMYKMCLLFTYLTAASVVRTTERQKM